MNESTPSLPPPEHTAAVVLIGNELLSGKIRDENGAFLLQELRALGVRTTRLEVVADELADIEDAVRRCRRAAQHVFTSGGIGPTHDDLTVPGVARALGRRVVRAPELEAMLRAHYGEALDEHALRLAEVPEGAELLWGAGRSLRFPAILAENVLVLPGVPSLFAEKFEALKERFRAPPIALKNLYVSVGESRLAALLIEANERFAGIEIGSYPRFDAADHRVRLTVESRDARLVEGCAAFLRERLADAVVRETGS